MTSTSSPTPHPDHHADEHSDEAPVDAAALADELRSRRRRATLTPLPSTLALRTGSTCTFGGSSSRVLDTGYATSAFVESLTGSANSFDFYSSPLSSSMNLLAGDNGDAAVWINNVGGADIIVNVSASFFDYDSNTGTQTLLVTTATNTGTTIHAGMPVKVDTGPGAGLLADYPIPVGHQLKATIEIDVTSGTATDGRFEYARLSDPRGTPSSRSRTTER